MGSEKVTINKIMTDKQSYQFIQGTNTEEVIDRINHFAGTCKSIGAKTDKPNFVWKHFPHILKQLTRRKYDEVLEEEKTERKADGKTTNGLFTMDRSERDNFKVLFICKYVPDKEAKETMIDAFSTVYGKPDNVSVKDHNSCCLVLESFMEDLEGERKTKSTPNEKL